MNTLLLYLAAFIGGAAVLIMEILGTRIISPFYGATIFVWTSTISMTLGALTVGYWLGGKLADRYPVPKVLFSALILSGLFFLVPVKIDQWVLYSTNPLGLKLGPLLSSFLLFFIPLMLLGTISPITIRLITSDARSSGKNSGNVFAISTIGSILGGLLSGFVLIPRFPITKIFFGVSIVLVLYGIFCIILAKKIGSRMRVFVLFASFGYLLLTISPRVESQKKNSLVIIEQEQSYLGDIKVVDLKGVTYPRCLFVDGSGQTCVNENGETDGFFQRFLESEIPKQNLDENSKVLVLGLGGGGILSMLPSNVSVDVVELDEEVVRLSKRHFFFDNYPNVTMIIDDARHFLSISPPETYDLIIENIALGNSIPSYILSKESFYSMKNLLREGGIVLAHIGSFEVEGDNLFNEAVCSTAESVFENVTVLSSNPNELYHMVMYLSDNNIDSVFNEEASPVLMDCNPDLVVTDEKNPLDYYYLSNSILQRDSTFGLGSELFYVN